MRCKIIYNSPEEILWGSIRLEGNNAAARDKHRKIVQDDRAEDPSSAKVTNITTHINYSLLHAILVKKTQNRKWKIEIYNENCYASRKM